MDSHDLVEHLFRRQSGHLVAALARQLGARHLALAEDAVQDALVTALQQWPFGGVPERPEAWLFQVARNRALDRLRHHAMAGQKAPALTRDAPRESPPPDIRLGHEAEPLGDDELGLMFLTCSPALSPASRVALTLKLVGGFSASEIGRAFLARPSAVQQRLVRARHQLRDAGEPVGVPSGAALAERLGSVQESVYLMFNEGYAATAGDALIREDLAGEAIRLGRLLARHPDTGVPESWALLSLMLLHAARFPARVGSESELYLLREQDRSRWDRSRIAEGLRALDRASAGTIVSRYHLEAGIAACHAVAPAWEDTDWRQVLALYDDLLALTASPVVALNRAIAHARVDGPVAGLADLEGLVSHPLLAGYHLLPSVEAALWREAGDLPRASAAYQRALDRARSTPERRWLARQLEETG